MRKIFLLAALIAMKPAISQSFRYDNTLYNTVYPEDLCNTLKENKGYVLLDVRSPGEYADTSSSPSFNMGHLKGAINITISELGSRIHELDKVKGKPIFIYCSHSQRSRRASKMLVDSGFANIYNINGGMTAMVKQKSSLPPCFSDIYESKVAYKILSPEQVAEMQIGKNPFYIIDIRPDSVYRGISSYEKLNSLGRFNSSVNVVSSMIEANISKIPKGKPILVVDSYGDESPEAAELLMNFGFKNVSVLFNGMDAWLEYSLANEKSAARIWSSPTQYKILNQSKFTEILQKDPSTVVIDIRNADQFNNKSNNYWENIGHLKNAKSIPYAQIEQGISNTVPSKSTTIVLYIFSNQNEVYQAARKLKSMGYNNVNVLYGGIWNIRSAAYNAKGMTHLRDWVVDVPPENQ